MTQACEPCSDGNRLAAIGQCHPAHSKVHICQLHGPVPKDMQHVSVFCGGVHTAAKNPEAGRALLNFILSPVALPFIKHSGMEQGAS